MKNKKPEKSGIRIYMRGNPGQDTDDKITIDMISIEKTREDGDESENQRLRQKIAEILQTDSDNVEVVILNGTS